MVTSDGNNSAVWDAESITITHLIDGFSPTYCSNGQYIITSDIKGDDYLLNIWDSKSYTITNIINQNTLLSKGGISPQCSPDGRHIAANYGAQGRNNYKIAIWDLKTLQIEEVITQTDFVLSFQYSPDSKELAIGRSDSTVTIWNIDNKNDRIYLVGHTQVIFHVSYSPDGNMLATSSLDGTSKVWDTKDGTLLFTLSDHQGAVVSSSFSADGRKLVTASRDGTIRQYLIKTDDLLRLASSRVTRDLLPEERKQFIETVVMQL